MAEPASALVVSTPANSAAFIAKLKANPPIFGQKAGEYHYICAYSGFQTKEAVCIPEAILKGESESRMMPQCNVCGANCTTALWRAMTMFNGAVVRVYYCCENHHRLDNNVVPV